MGWREVIAASQYDWDMGIVGGSQPTWAEYRERDLENAVLYETCGNCHAAALLAMPAAARIAMARELLAGTGRVVARDVGTTKPDAVPWRYGDLWEGVQEDADEENLDAICNGYADGWNACRAAMLADPDA